MCGTFGRSQSINLDNPRQGEATNYLRNTQPMLILANLSIARLLISTKLDYSGHVCVKLFF
jgi:hypothetical protein